MPGLRSMPRIMGILNTTPDSFSDGGRYTALDAALAQAEHMRVDGADVIDVGGESTRPGAADVAAGEEIARALPVIEALAARGMRISVDTRKAAVARAAVDAGAAIWNDVSALTHDLESLETAAALRCEVVLMHMQGEPATMQRAPSYGDVVSEVAEWLLARAQAAMAAGVRRERIWLDPGIGFGKTLAHNLALIRGVGHLTALGFPVLFGASRKGVIRALDPSAGDPGDRLGGSIALALAAARAGCAMIRAHDVRETRQALSVAAAIEASAA